MSMQLASATVVVVAEQFNPSITSQIWLADHGVINRDEFENDSVYTEVMVHAASKKFALLISPEQLQFSPRVPPKEIQELIIDRLGKLIRTLPHTPFTAIGLNSTWHCFREDEDFALQTQDLFGSGENPVIEYFRHSGAHFGAYCSQDYLKGRLKLDIKPVHAMKKTSGEEFDTIQFSYNYHVELRGHENPASEIIQVLSSWDEVAKETEKITGLINWEKK